MSTLPTAAELSLYFEGRKASPVYEDACRMYQQIRVHADGEKPGELISRRRPNESAEIQAYRLQIFEPITKQTFNRVLQSLGKIRRSRDWAIRYSRDYKFPLVPDGETMQDYCEYQFPYYTSVTNWLFSVMLKSVLVDANCAVLVLPLQGLGGATSYKKPFPTIFYADQIVEYMEGRFAIFRASEQVQVPKGKTTTLSDKFYYITPNEVVPYIKIGDNWTALTDEVITHGLGYLPIVRPRAQYARSVNEHQLFESRIAAMIPSLNEAIREYSDLQAAVVSHLFPERWEIATQECNVCNGVGLLPNPAYTGTDGRSKQLVCSACNGLGATAGSSPYKKTLIRLPKTNLGEQPIPTPPFDYVKKDIEVIKVMQDRMEGHLYRGLAAINMQFLGQTPLSISGDAKMVDRDELNNFVYNIAEDLVYIADYIYAIICDYRYSYQYPATVERRRMLPYIAVPEAFELLGADDTMASITQMRGNGIGGSLLTALLRDYAKRQFAQEKDVAQALLLEMELDPFAGMTEADKSAMLQSGNIRRQDYIKSAYIRDFIKRAVAEHEGYAELPYEQQVSILDVYAMAIIDDLTAGEAETEAETQAEEAVITATVETQNFASAAAEGESQMQDSASPQETPLVDVDEQKILPLI